MSLQRNSSNIKPRILYQVAKAAWEGNLYESRDKICQLVYHEFQDKTSRRNVANQIRIAMGLDPHHSEDIISHHDQEALTGMISNSIIVANSDACQHCSDADCPCEQACSLGAISHPNGILTIDQDKCLGEGHCISACSFGAIAEKSQFVPLINLLRQKIKPVYAAVAPAFAGQFGGDVSAGKFRSALLKLGFTDMLETALCADLVTMKEAFEFNEHIKKASDFMITSCCCPVWIKLIENKFPELLKHISPSVSPMVASARVLKAFEAEAKVVFIGPCIAKKSEALLPDLKGAIDFVLTFQELSYIFQAAEVEPAKQPDIENSQASWSGRIYARAGGVSQAVGITLSKLVPRRAQTFTPIAVDGIPDCQNLLKQIQCGHLTANFVEGMACQGGCVGGPGCLIPPTNGKEHVNHYGAAALAQTPVENPQVYAILNRLGQPSEKISLIGESPIAQLLARKLK